MCWTTLTIRNVLTELPREPGFRVVVYVVGMIDEVVSEMFVQIEWMDRKFGVPLPQLEPVNPDTNTREAINDWHYWESDGTRLC